MRARTFGYGVVALCATALVTAGLFAQTKPGDEKKPPAPKPADTKQPAKTGDKAAEKHPDQEMSPQQQAMFEAVAKYSTLGEPHKNLAKKEGKWALQGKWWMEPDSEAMEFTGTSTFKMILDGHYLQETVEGNEPEENGQVFKGMGIIGYDNFGKQYVVVWVDNMGTGVSQYKGTATPEGSTINFTGEEPDYITGKYKQTRSVERKISDDQYVHTMYDKTADGKEYKHMELTYMRAGAKPASPSMAPAAPKKP